MTEPRLILGDCMEALRELPDASVDAVVTDPPYGINFMGKAWDGKAIEEAASQPRDLSGVSRLTGSHDSASRKPIERTGSAFANRAGEAGAYDFSLGSYGDERDWSKMGGPTGKDNTTHTERGGAMHAGRYDQSPKGNRGFQVWTEAWAREAFRVLKPGGHLLCFASTRTYHRMACGVEEAGFEIRDQLAWMFGSGFPKSHDVGKAIDKLAGVDTDAPERYEHVDHPGRAGSRSGTRESPVGLGQGKHASDANPDGLRHLYRHESEDARTWAGYGTALKPAFEPVVVARKPLAGTVAANVIAHGVGALNIDGCRIGTAERPVMERTDTIIAASSMSGESTGATSSGELTTLGRWPANVVLGHSDDCVQVGTRTVASDGHFPTSRPAGVFAGKGHDGLEERTTRGETVTVWECADGCPVAMLDAQTVDLGKSSGTQQAGNGAFGTGVTYGAGEGLAESGPIGFGDRGGASRFFYCAKVSRAERNAGLDSFELRRAGSIEGGGGLNSTGDHAFARNHHPTVKPLDLMRWLIRLVTPEGGTVCDPFLGSGSTGCAAALEGRDFVGIEREADYMEVARARIAFWTEHGEDGLRIVAERDAAERVREERAATGQLDLFAEQA